MVLVVKATLRFTQRKHTKKPHIQHYYNIQSVCMAMGVSLHAISNDCSLKIASHVSVQ